MARIWGIGETGQLVASRVSGLEGVLLSRGPVRIKREAVGSRPILGLRLWWSAVSLLSTEYLRCLPWRRYYIVWPSLEKMPGAVGRNLLVEGY